MKFIFGVVVYLVVAFPLAFFRHMKWFEKKYVKREYAGKHPSIPLGFASLVIQGIVLSYLFATANIDQTSTKEAVWYTLTIGLLFRSCHVIKAMAKNHSLRNEEFFIYETVFVFLQFCLFGILMSALVY